MNCCPNSVLETDSAGVSAESFILKLKPVKITAPPPLLLISQPPEHLTILETLALAFTPLGSSHRLHWEKNQSQEISLCVSG